MLEKASISADDLPKVLDELRVADAISEVLVLSTCNRIEVYADVARFHAAVAQITNVLARHGGVEVSDLGDPVPGVPQFPHHGQPAAGLHPVDA